ncbi:AraC family transcriptional regulator [Mucilaginibacter sabulilitoris]|uniref:AraC family transcriptional regulator n=1 Tax=Mucilaginibacter sabulilitoris TaxID=1173583 RepID=A0ABZ0TTU6_9SPHI|nr:AraC family transcriptional regulator [Mucilaginibacter sabulilitoris]WPU95209.1 AraC family transcriptional regulator [Mucilaginibacter sabulilitoris]
MNKPPLVKEITRITDSLNIRISDRFGAGNDSGKHEHEHANLVFILNGGCTEKRQHFTYEREAADIAFLHAGEAHETTFTEIPTRYISLDIKPNAFAENNLTEGDILNTIKKCPDAKFLVLKMYRELLYNDDLTIDSVKMLFSEFASLSLVMTVKKSPPIWVNIVYQLLNDKWNETVTLKELSQAAGVNPITISKHFPTYFACTLGSYLRKLRIERSLSLIKNEGTSLTQTAYACNFSDQSHFIRNFRIYTSLSPKQYEKL